MSLLTLALAVAPVVDRDLDFAAYLYRKGEYFQAAGEYHRWLFAHAGPGGDRARYGLGMCYLRGHRDEDARASLAAVGPTATVATRARHGLAVALIRLGRPAEARAALSGADGDVAPAHRLTAALAAGRAGDWTAAAALLARADRPGFAAGAREAADFRPPSPWVAGALALVPGAGQAYVGRSDEAAATFLPPVALGLAAWYYGSRGEPWLAGLTGTGAAAFWAGNVYGAVDAAGRAAGEASERVARPLERAVDDTLPEVD